MHRRLENLICVCSCGQKCVCFLPGYLYGGLSHSTLGFIDHTFICAENKAWRLLRSIGFFLSQSVQSHVGFTSLSDIVVFGTWSTQNDAPLMLHLYDATRVQDCSLHRLTTTSSIPGSLHNAQYFQRESRKVVAPADHNPYRNDVYVFKRVLPLFVFAIVLIIYLSLRFLSLFLLSLSFWGECSTALCSLQGFFICLLLLVALLKNITLQSL
jgi:hypothetical protein